MKCHFFFGCETDPEIYAELASAYPEQVKAIFIRRSPEKLPTTAAKDGRNLALSKEAGAAEEVEAALMIASTCGEEDDEDLASSGSLAIQNNESSQRNDAEIECSLVTETMGHVNAPHDQSTTRITHQFQIEVSESDRECLAELTEERKEREWKRFEPLFAPLREHTLCRVFTCPSEIAHYTLDSFGNLNTSASPPNDDVGEWGLHSLASENKQQEAS